LLGGGSEAAPPEGLLAEGQAMLGAVIFAGKGVPGDPVEVLHALMRPEAGEPAAGFLREALARTRPLQHRGTERRATGALP
jgi:hypothetical protein